MIWNLNFFSSFEQYSFPTSFYEFNFLRVFSYCLVHHPGISSNITDAAHFITPSTPPTLVLQPPYPHWHTTNGVTPIIMNEVFNFQENERYNLRSGIHLASRKMNTAHFGTDTISSLGPKLWKLIADKIKHASTLSAFKANIKSWTINNCQCRLCKIFAEDLGFLENFYTVGPIIHTNIYIYIYIYIYI